MSDIDTQLHAYFEATTDEVRIDEILDPGVVVVGPGGSRTERNREMDTKERTERDVTPPGPKRGPWIAAAVAAVAIIATVGVVLLAGGGADPDVVVTEPPPTTVAPTTAPPTTAPPTTDAAVDAAASDAATPALDGLIEAFNAEDSDAIAGFFGDDVVYTSPQGDELVGTAATEFWLPFLGQETAERIGEGYRAPDDRMLFLVQFTRSSGFESTQVFELEMDGDRLVSLGDRGQAFDEIIAEGEVDDIHAAFNDQDLERLTELFDGVTYTSPSGVEFVGSQAAERWAEAFGETAERATGVFLIGDNRYGYVAEYTEPDSGRSTAYGVEIEMSGSQITSFAERRARD